MSVSTLIVSQALIRNQDGVTLHPDLLLWDRQLNGCKQQWFECGERNPLAWYATLAGVSSTALVADACDQIPASTGQCWLASPYHAQLSRDNLRVYPEGLFSWSVEDAHYLCTVLNLLLQEEGMQLLVAGAALLLVCRDPMQAYPLCFAQLSGKMLPNRHHEGEDGGRLNRLLSEIQMLLFQHPSIARHERGEEDVNGLWLWAPLDWPHTAQPNRFAVATRNPLLQSLVDAQDAQLIISEAERLAELVKGDAPLPKKIILSGEGFAVVLSKPILPKFGKTVWQPKSVKDERGLLTMLQGVVA
ncbi:MAG: threonine synthase [Zetaproteobacteria bacterium CG1_02_53_45]|nr:MAG: threonine synthase [Zetaproteobacteria bacterium CG1_02_53_45]